MKSTTSHSIKKTLLAAMIGSFVTGMGSGVALAQVNIADAPLFLTSSIDPNIMFILDDSGSMQWEHMPDQTMFFTLYVFPRPTGLYGGEVYANQVPDFNDANLHNVFSRSPENNAVFYNPMITYTPWRNADNAPFLGSGDVDPASAPYNPADLTRGTLNLTTQQTQSANWFRNITNTTQSSAWLTCGSPCNQTFWPTTFYRYKSAGNRADTANYVKYQIRGTNAFTQDLNGGTESAVTSFVWVEGATTITRTVLEERQNFANWFSYYRSRVLASRAGIGRAFAQQGEGMRVGFGAINVGSSTIDGVSSNHAIIRGVRQFSGTDRAQFFDDLYTHTIPTSGTPLRRALRAAGDYYTRSDDAGPWGAVPGGSDTRAHLECRQSYTILMTDGFWNGSDPGVGNSDNTDGQVIDNHLPNGTNYQYIASDATSAPFRDNWNNTLADVAMEYWKTDLRTNLDNRVPPSAINPAFWQHMVTFGVGLGVSGTIDPNTAFAAIGTTNAIAWPDPGASNPAKLDDLLHAGVNSRGGFFSAADPDTFADEMDTVLQSIVTRAEASGTAAATSSAVLQTDTLLYTASFRSTDWSGTLVAREVLPSGALGSVKFDVEQRLSTTSAADRNIYTLKDDGTRIALNWTALGTSQQTALGMNPSATGTTATGADRIQWLKGVEHAGLRDRTGSGTARKIGSLIGSDPQFMFRRDFGSSRLPLTEGSSYTVFRNSTTYKSRPDAIFVGSNGGMLHAFHAGTPFIDDPLDPNTPPAKIMNPDGGKELFAFVPSELLVPRAGSSDTHAQINELMIPEYDHRYYVDGTATWRDAYVSGSWKTVLVGAMGAGGRTVFALDVSDPENFSAGNIMWEFGYADVDCNAGATACREVGYGITQPSIARLTDGTWVAIFGNGYNSASHQAKLFVVNLANGQLINMIDTGVGSAASPNGLAPAIATVWPADPSSPFSVSRAYAGDLQGNLWRFDLTGGMGFVRLFSATDAGGAPQPITARPTVAAYPGDSGKVVVTFGTGSFFRVADSNLATPQTQSLYGIFDTVAGQTNLVRGQLLAQTIVTNGSEVTLGTAPNQRTYPAGSLRTLSSNAITTEKGWLVNLPDAGERVISEATFPSSLIRTRIRFSTLVPDQDPCSSGRDGYLMDFDLLSGGSYASSVFDLTGDGYFDLSDLWGGLVVSGIGGLVKGERITNLRREGYGLEYLYGGDPPPVDCSDLANASDPACTDLPTSPADFPPPGRQSWRQIR